MTNCVMGFAHGPHYDWKVLSPFVRSLREKAGFEGDIVFFMGKQADGITKEMFEKYRVTNIVTEPQFAPWGLGFMMARFWKQREDIAANPRWDNLLLVDTRDMIFQSNLDKFFQGGLHLQRESIVIKEDKWFNSAGVLASWGQEVLDEIGDKPVLNSGSIWGDRASVLDVLSKMLSCGAHENCDQHALMYLAHKQNLSAIQHDNNGEYVWTIAMTDVRGCEFKDGLIYQADGHLPPVVHQYDRFPELKSQVQDYYQ